MNNKMYGAQNAHLIMTYMYSSQTYLKAYYDKILLCFRIVATAKYMTGGSVWDRRQKL